MNFFKLISLGICFVTCAVLSQAEVKNNTAVTSPDRTFTARYAFGDGEKVVAAITITNSLTGVSYPPIEFDSPLFSLKWTGDSKTIGVIKHIAGGTIANVLHFSNGKWNMTTADPGFGDRYAVVKEVLLHSTIKFGYTVLDRPGGGEPGSCYYYSFVFHPDSAARTSEKKNAISLEDYERLKFIQ